MISDLPQKPSIFPKVSWATEGLERGSWTHQAENPSLTMRRRRARSQIPKSLRIVGPQHASKDSNVSQNYTILVTFLQTVLLQIIKTDKRVYASRKHLVNLQRFSNLLAALLVH